MFRVFLIVLYVSSCHALSHSSYSVFQTMATGMEWLAGIVLLVLIVSNPITIVIALAGLLFGAWLGKK